MVDIVGLVVSPVSVRQSCSTCHNLASTGGNFFSSYRVCKTILKSRETKRWCMSSSVQAAMSEVILSLVAAAVGISQGRLGVVPYNTSSLLR